MCFGATVARKKLAWDFSLPAFTVIITTFTWYTLIGTVFPQIVSELHLPGDQSLAVLCLYYSGTIVSAFFGATVMRSRQGVLKLWLVLGIASSLLLLFVGSNPPLSSLLVALFLGPSIGIGLPSCLTYFADAVKTENRGVLGGVAWTIVSVVIFPIAVAMSTLDYVSTVLLLATIRGFGLVVFLLSEKKHEEPPKAQKRPSYATILSRKTLILYFTSWFMFCLVNWVEMPVVNSIFTYELFVLSGSIEVVISGISAPIAGYFSDKIGRKRVIVAGFVLLGIGYAMLGLFPASFFAQYAYVALDGVAWGIFATVFFMTLWGDLAEDMQKERFYFIGGLPYLLAQFLSTLVRPYASFVQANAAFSLASFFLFLAVLPLMYAPETLSEKKIKETELKGYIERAKKAKEKYT
jgi:MFS family permease